MNAKILILIIFSFFLIFGCLEKQQSESPKIEITENEKKEISSEKNVEQQPLEQKISNDCRKIENTILRDECYLKFAIESRNSSVCSKIYSIEILDRCLEQFMTDEIELCQKITSPSLKEKCYKNAAYKTNDTNYCLKINKEEEKLKCLKDLSPPCTFEKDEISTGLCYSLLYKDIKYCKGNSECIILYANKTKEINSCDFISENELAKKYACKALAKDNPIECKFSNISSTSDYCFEIVAKNLNDKNICDYATKGSIYANKCYKDFAIKNNDIGLCVKLEPETERDRCYSEYSIATGEYTACEKIYSSVVRLECYYKTAIQKLRIDACNKLNYQAKTNCYNNVLNSNKKIQSLEMCNQISEEEKEYWLAKCYLKYALDNNDITACALIEKEEYKQQCYNALEK